MDEAKRRKQWGFSKQEEKLKIELSECMSSAEFNFGK